MERVIAVETTTWSRSLGNDVTSGELDDAIDGRGGERRRSSRFTLFLLLWRVKPGSVGLTACESYVRSRQSLELYICTIRVYICIYCDDGSVRTEIG